MHEHSHILAATQGLGKIYDCGHCQNIHVQVGPVNITLTPDAYLQVVEMFNRSAANFEVLLERRSRAGNEMGTGANELHHSGEGDL